MLVLLSLPTAIEPFAGIVMVLPLTANDALCSPSASAIFAARTHPRGQGGGNVRSRRRGGVEHVRRTRARALLQRSTPPSPLAQHAATVGFCPCEQRVRSTWCAARFKPPVASCISARVRLRHTRPCICASVSDRRARHSPITSLRRPNPLPDFFAPFVQMPLSGSSCPFSRRGQHNKRTPDRGHINNIPLLPNVVRLDHYTAVLKGELSRVTIRTVE